MWILKERFNYVENGKENGEENLILVRWNASKQTAIHSNSIVPSYLVKGEISGDKYHHAMI